jgi:hypothetical protein
MERLPVILRVYIACGAILYGDIQTADLVKIHIGSRANVDEVRRLRQAAVAAHGGTNQT